MEKSLIFSMAIYYFYLIFLLFYMFTSRKKAIKNKEVKASHFRSYQGEIPDQLKIIENHFNNQFQMPLVFFVVCLLHLQQKTVDSVTITLAYLFIGSRFIHSFIHLKTNNIIHRVLSYFLGTVIIGIMFLKLLI